MEIDLEKGQIPAVLELSYRSHLHFDLTEIDYKHIDWTQVERMYCKYCTLTIHMKNGDIHEFTTYSDTEADYKWPTKMTLFDIEWAVLDEE